MKCLYLVTRSLDPTGRVKARWAMRWVESVRGAGAALLLLRFPGPLAGRHRPNDRRPAHRPHRPSQQCCVQPRRIPSRIGQQRRHTAGVASLGVPGHAVCQADRQHESPTMARLGLTRHRLHQGLPGPPGRVGLGSLMKPRSLRGPALCGGSAGDRKCGIVLTPNGFC